MSNTAIMTDSNCGIMPDEGRDLGIYVLPMPLIIDGQTYYEGVDITLDEFFKRQISGADITTSQPSPGDVEAMWTDHSRCRCHRHSAQAEARSDHPGRQTGFLRQGKRIEIRFPHNAERCKK